MNVSTKHFTGFCCENSLSFEAICREPKWGSLFDAVGVEQTS